MLAVTKITTTYSPREDRIRLAMASKDGETLILWLSQRLVNHFIVEICRWLEAQVANVGGESLQDRTVRIAASMAQETAVANIVPAKPVEPKSQPDEWLVSNIKCSLAEGAVKLVFTTDGDRDVARTTYSSDAMRQWLHIFHRIYQRAQWATSAWPQWFIDAEAQTPPTQRQLH